jgi:hypothetical protein
MSHTAYVCSYIILIMRMVATPLHDPAPLHNPERSRSTAPQDKADEEGRVATSTIGGVRLIIFMVVLLGPPLYYARMLANKAVRLLPRPLVIHKTEDQTMPKKDLIFFKHMRKSGGTTLRHYIYNRLLNVSNSRTECQQESEGERPYKITETINAICKTDRWTYYEQEYGSLSIDCATSQSWDRVLTMTIFREPLARHWSEFWNKVNGPVDNLLNMSRDQVKEVFLDWVGHEGGPAYRRTLDPNETKRFNKWRPTGMNAGSYYANFQTRHFLGNCTSGRNQEQPADSKPFWCSADSQKFWCSAGPGCKGGCIFQNTPRHISSEKMQVALGILNKFDIVLTTETLRACSSSLERIMTKVSGTTAPNNTFLQDSSRSPGGIRYPSMTKILDEDTMKMLRQDNAADLELYNVAQRLAFRFC